MYEGRVVRENDGQLLRIKIDDVDRIELVVGVFDAQLIAFACEKKLRRVRAATRERRGKSTFERCGLITSRKVWRQKDRSYYRR